MTEQQVNILGQILGVLVGIVWEVLGFGDDDNPPVFVSSPTFVVEEGNTDVGTVQAVDPEGQPVTYTLTGGADIGKFAINSTTGDLDFLVAPVFSPAGDADGNNLYEVEVTASDGTMMAVQAVSAQVTPSEVGAPVPCVALQDPDASLYLIPDNWRDGTLYFPDDAEAITHWCDGGTPGTGLSDTSPAGNTPIYNATEVGIEWVDSAGAYRIHAPQCTVGPLDEFTVFFHGDISDDKSPIQPRRFLVCHKGPPGLETVQEFWSLERRNATYEIEGRINWLGASGSGHVVSGVDVVGRQTVAFRFTRTSDTGYALRLWIDGAPGSPYDVTAQFPTPNQPLHSSPANMWVTGQPALVSEPTRHRVVQVYMSAWTDGDIATRIAALKATYDTPTAPTLPTGP